ncbi:protein rapunzel-like [Pristis pectinata]|uniref:protein rapunzel-like n=1 Tax=Pristis pectinata TaxID=685728 RepID=UPI00223D323A|nr:protein rapunzel-like [Pristis pectinata]XP_051872435.1 protein rapunzel-like [Pristis pectinata]XP_051872437.1 protein rapunzel-like [Pristis pectinata]XP_051872438.1 protein rapunzel-like [Pristis pectinata]
MSQPAGSALELSKSAVEAVQAAMAFIESAEKFASALGVLGPIIGVAAAVVKLALGNVDSPELAFMKKQFQAVRNQLDVISGQISEVLREIDRSTTDNQYFPIEENIKNQFRKYIDILDAAPEFRQKEKEEFLKHFNATKGDQNLHTLYDGVMGNTGAFGKSILDTAMNCDQRNRRLMEGICARLKNLFCIGLIAVLGHAGITGNDVKALETEWNQKLVEVEGKMKSMVDRCINEFAEQAKIDVKKLIEQKGGRDNRECSSNVLENLINKYDWVRWSVRVYDPVGGFDNHCVGGFNVFLFFRLNNVNIVVSYTTDPKPVDITSIKQSMQGKEHWNDAREVLKHAGSNLTGRNVVHTVRRYKGLSCHNNFPDGCHYLEDYSGVTVCVHPV